MKTILVDVISEGYAYGKTYINRGIIDCKNIYEGEETEKQKLDTALNKALSELDKKGDLEEYFSIQRMILLDPVLKKNAFKLIEDKKLCALESIKLVFDEYKKNLLSSSSTYLQERIYDLEDIKRRVVRILANKKAKIPNEPFILVTDELMPTFLLEYKHIIVGIVAKKAGYMSHGAILARSYEIPFVTTDNISYIEDDNIVIDTRRKIVVTKPNKALVDEITKLSNERNSFEVVAHEGMLLLANVFGNEEIKKVKRYGCDGIGLYRTEFMFMHENRPLGFLEQKEIYTEAVKMLGDKPICFRTFDVGDDKQISYIKTHKKGFLNYVNNKELFENQIKALLASNLYGNMRIMFPMVETKEEFNYLKDWVLRIKKEINDTNHIMIGMMLETKQALLHIEEFTEADFFSIGTNDLTMELYQIRRDEIKDGVLDYLNDLLEKLKLVVAFCNKTGKCLSVCGELAAIPKANKHFMEIGIKNFSVSCSAFYDLNKSVKEELEKNNFI